MTRVQLALASLVHHRRTHIAVALGVASAVAVLAGALLVGASVRASLAALTGARLGRTDIVLAGEMPFTSTLPARLSAQPGAGVADAVSLLALDGSVRHDASSRRASGVRVYGVDATFFAFHRVSAAAPEGLDAWLSPDLAAELGASAGDAILLRVPRPTDVPADTLFGAKEGAGRSFRLQAKGTLPRDAMGEFSIAAGQGPVRALFVSLARLQRDLALEGRVNTGLLATGSDATQTLPVAKLATAVVPADLGLVFEVRPETATMLVESSSGLLADDIATAIERAGAAESLSATPVLTWLATTLTVGDRTTPYSLITALGPTAGGDLAIAQRLRGGTTDRPAIVLNDWAARDLQASPGDPLTLEYFRWAPEGRLVTERATFTVTGVVPIAGLAADRRLAPVYPGITDSTSLGDWDPPFPIDLSRVRPVDDEYWRERRTTPKAFVPLAVGQRLWGTRYGKVTSMRLQPRDAGVDLASVSARLQPAIVSQIDPLAAGLRLVDVRRQNLAASTGATDFGAYFTYFSFFLMVSGLLLSSLFFRLSLEQRMGEIGVLRAAGFSLAAVRRQFVIEGGLVALAGAAVGIVLAVGWAALMMYGLRVWWVGAVGTTRLQLHVDPLSLLIGAVGGIVAALLAIVLTIRGLAHTSPRQLLTGGHDIVARVRSRSRSGWLAVSTGAGALGLSALSLADAVPDAAGFFGAGTLLLVAGLAGLGLWLGRRVGGSAGLIRLGINNASWRPTRTLTSAGLVAAAVFLLVSVDAFRKGTGLESGPSSGTGGYALVGESTMPIVHDPGTVEGRRALGLDRGPDDQDLAGVDLMLARLRPGDDASCLNLYQPASPRILGVPQRWIEARRFRFAEAIAPDATTRGNPWQLLGPPGADGVIPAIADHTSLQYVLHAGVGDIITIDAASARPHRLRIVAALDDTMLQGEILVAESAFTKMFPDLPGYRFMLAAVTPETPERIDRVTRELEQRLEQFGLDLGSSAARLEAYHRVENTYLSTFQALGGLGLVLGCAGLAAVVARSVLERRRELALLGATGYTGRDLQIVVLAEQCAVVCWGLGIGVIAALVAVAPMLASRGVGPIGAALAWPAIVLAAGVLSAVAATRMVRRLPLVASLRSE